MLHEERELTLADVDWDEEFAGIMNPHLPEAADDFTESIMSAGEFTHPILVFYEDGHYPVIDGYHRMKWASLFAEDAGIEMPKVKVMTRLTSRVAAKYWVRVCQTGRRNLSVEDQRYHRGKALTEKMIYMKETTGTVGDTVEQFAEANRITVRTAYREKEYAKAVDRIAATAPEIAQKIRAGVVGINAKEVVKMSQRRPERIAEAAENLTHNRKWNDDGSGGEMTEDEAKEMRRYRVIENKLSTLLKTLLPAVREHFILIHREIYPDGPPERGGFPMVAIDEHTSQLIGIVRNWKPAGPCSECQYRGCPRCKRLGFKRSRTR